MWFTIDSIKGHNGGIVIILIVVYCLPVFYSGIALDYGKGQAFWFIYNIVINHWLVVPKDKNIIGFSLTILTTHPLSILGEWMVYTRNLYLNWMVGE
jgi:hypothetical protein